MPKPNNYRWVYFKDGGIVSPEYIEEAKGCGEPIARGPDKGKIKDCNTYNVNRYNFETGVWSNDQGENYKNGERVE
jgi:hypothetical protein